MKKKVKRKEKSRKRRRYLSEAWNPEKMLEMILKGQEKVRGDWLEKGLPKLVDKLMKNYLKHESIDHIEGKDLPSKTVVIEVLNDILSLLFPGYIGTAKVSKSNLKRFISNTLRSIYERLVEEVDKSLKYVCRRVQACPEDVCHRRAEIVVAELLENIPKIRMLLKGDVEAAYNSDPAANSLDEIVLSYPCVYAIATYRVAHELYIRNVPLVPRIMSEHAHSITGIDIHPGAKIGKNFFIDHGTGVVIGETTEIGDNVRIYQGVTLGALSFPKGEVGGFRGVKRHPTIKDNVIIYSGATVLGGKTVIGKNTIIGGNVWITSSVPANTTVAIAPPKLIYKTSKKTKRE